MEQMISSGTELALCLQPSFFLQTLVCVCTYRLFLVVIFLRPDVQLQRSGGELVEGRRELKAVLEQRHPGEDVQAQSGSRHGHHQTPDVPAEEEEEVRRG